MTTNPDQELFEECFHVRLSNLPESLQEMEKRGEWLPRMYFMEACNLKNKIIAEKDAKIKELERILEIAGISKETRIVK